jgi:hypothetical protein
MSRAVGMAASRRSNRPFVLSATVDFPGDLCWGPYSLDLLDRMVGQLKTTGIRRINWIYYGDIDPASYWAGNQYNDPIVHYGPQTIAAIGEPLRAVVPIAHRHGLEIYGVLKPYDTGFSGTFPAGSPEARNSAIRRIGGTVELVSPFVERHAQMRMRRRPVAAPAALPVSKMRLAKKDASPTRVGVEHLEIWTSPDNYRYTRKHVPYALAESVEAAPRDVRDYHGRVVTARGAPVRVLTLSNLDLTEPFVVITTDLRDMDGDFANTASAMLEVYGPAMEALPIVLATRTANRRSDRDFRTDGLEFDSGFAPYEFLLDVDNAFQRQDYWWNLMPSHGAIAFARGKNDYLAGAVSEVYPEVRRLWVGWVDRILATGADGVDLRISAHGTLTDEPLEYGFNPPVVQEYLAAYGDDPLGSRGDLRQLARLRGRHYTDFVREASRRVRRAGKKLDVHLHSEAFRPSPSHGQMMGFPPNIEFDWRAWVAGMVDGVTLRATWFEGLEYSLDRESRRSLLPEALRDPVVEEMLAVAATHELPVMLNRYVSRAVSTDDFVADMERVYRDDRFQGFDVYEVLHLMRPTPDGSDLRPVEERLERLGVAARKLGIR